MDLSAPRTVLVDVRIPARPAPDAATPVTKTVDVRMDVHKTVLHVRGAKIPVKAAVQHAVLAVATDVPDAVVHALLAVVMAARDAPDVLTVVADSVVPAPTTVQGALAAVGVPAVQGPVRAAVMAAHQGVAEAV